MRRACIHSPENGIRDPLVSGEGTQARLGIDFGDSEAEKLIYYRYWHLEQMTDCETGGDGI